MRRAVAQTIKVVNAIIREQGRKPVNIHLELAREMSKNFQQRNDLDKAMKDNNAENERLMKTCMNCSQGEISQARIL